MAMTQEQFDALVARREREASASPRAYALKLAALASLGYLYIAVVLLALVAIVVALFMKGTSNTGLLSMGMYLAYAVAALFVLVLRAMWVRLEPPEGLALERSSYPALFATIDEVQHATKAPRPHAVLLTPDFNASVEQVPRLGLFGWQVNYLLLGLPLMQILSHDEFRAVLAHEFGHLSAAHGRFGAWIYRVRATWERIAEAPKEEQAYGSFLFMPFSSWFAPRFAAYSFVMARQQEFEADHLAAQAVGIQTATNALVRVEIKAWDLEYDYWPGVLKAADHHPDPAPVAPYSGLSAPEPRGFLPTARTQLDQALREPTSTADTHPSLADRIEAIGGEPCIAGPAQQSSAEVLLGDKLDSLCADFDRIWRDHVAHWWAQRHGYALQARERLAELENRGQENLDEAELLELGELIEEFGDVRDALPVFRSLLARNPDDPVAMLAVGRVLLSQNDAEGLPMIEQAMQRSEDTVLAGCQSVLDYMYDNGRVDDAIPYRERYVEQLEVVARQQCERYSISEDDEFLTHDMPEEDLRRTAMIVRVTDGVRRAWLVRKRTEPEYPPLYLLGLDIPWWRIIGDIDPEEVQHDIASRLNQDDEFLVLSLTGHGAALRRKFESTERSLLS